MKSDDRMARATPSLLVWAADWGNSFSLVLVLWALCYLGLMSFVREATWWHVLKAVSFLPMNAGATVLALRASRRTGTDPRIRRALLLLGLAFGCVLIGNTVAFYERFVRENNPLVAWTNVLYFGLYVLGLAGLLSFPLARRAKNEYRKFLLDAGAVIVAGGLADWYLIIVPSNQHELGGIWGTIWALAYPICSLLLLLGVVTTILRRPTQRNPGASNVLLAGMVLYLLSDLANDLTILEYGWGGVSYTDVTYMMAYVLITSAFARYFWKTPIVVDEQDVKSRSQPFNYLPYVGVALCYTLLGVVAVRRWPDPMSVLAIGGIVITFLVVVRQIAAVRENVRLLSDQSKRENEARFEALVRHSTDVITIVDSDGIIRYVSPTITQIFGHQPGDLEGKRLSEIVHPDDVPRTLSFFTSVLPRGAVTTPAEWRMRHRYGGWRDVDVIGTNLLDEPTVRGIVLNTRDISERKALQA
jgi:PAS domain S-box-containing protein